MCTLEGFLPGFGWVYYIPDGIANMLFLAMVESRRRRITYDSWAGGIFHVHNPDSEKIVSFHKLPSGLYVHDINTLSQAMAFVELIRAVKCSYILLDRFGSVSLFVCMTAGSGDPVACVLIIYS